VLSIVIMGKPKSPKTRMKEYRERLKFNKEKYDQLKEKDRKRKQSSRKEQTQINSAVKAHRNNLNRQRVANFRAKSRNVATENNSYVYKSSRTLGKAVSRAVRSLPFSPRKKRVVVTKLAEKVGIVKSSIAPKNAISDETKQKVIEFYCRDDISRQAPGKRDYVTIWNKEGKIQLQKRHLHYTIKETHSLFQQDHHNIKIGKSAFAKLKPTNVLHRHETPKDACLCM